MQGERHRVSFPRSLHPSAEPPHMPPWSTMRVRPGARRETIEGIDGGRMQCVHPAVVQCVTRCQVETSRNSHMAAGCNACIRLMCNGCQAEAWQHLQHALLVVPEPFGRQRLQGPGGNMLSLARDASHGAELNFVTSAER